MKNEKGNVAMIAIIIVIVAITASVITWLAATRTQAPVQQAVVTQPTAPVTTTQPAKSTPQPIAQPVPADETANWQTYTNTMFGYSIKVPKEYTVTDNGGPTGVGRNSSVSMVGDYNGERVAINLHSEDGYVADGGCSEGDGNIKSLTTMDGQRIYICKDMYHVVDGTLYAAIGKINTAIDIAGDKDKTAQTQILFEKILSTLKFAK